MSGLAFRSTKKSLQVTCRFREAGDRLDQAGHSARRFNLDQDGRLNKLKQDKSGISPRNWLKKSRTVKIYSIRTLASLTGLTNEEDKNLVTLYQIFVCLCIVGRLLNIWITLNDVYLMYI